MAGESPPILRIFRGPAHDLFGNLKKQIVALPNKHPKNPEKAVCLREFWVF